MKKFIVPVLWVCLVFVACSQDVNPKVIDFMEQYYVLANQQKSLDLTTGPAAEKIKKEMALLTDVTEQNVQTARTGRSIDYKLVSKKEDGSTIAYLFELNVNAEGLESFKKNVSVIYDTKSQKIISYQELK